MDSKGGITMENNKPVISNKQLLNINIPGKYLPGISIRIEEKLDIKTDIIRKDDNDEHIRSEE